MASSAFFLYLGDPDENRIELYTGDYIGADPDWVPIRWKLNDPRRQTFWGAPTPESWFNEAMIVRSQRNGEFAKIVAPKVKDRPVTFSRFADFYQTMSDGGAGYSIGSVVVYCCE